MCKVLDVSRSGYYEWVSRPPSKREKENERILAIAKESHQNSLRRYGLDKIHLDVKEQIPNCSRNRVWRILKSNNIHSIRKRKFKATTNSNHKLPVAENILNQNFEVNTPNTIWVTDISYIETDEGWLYLAIVKDLFNKEIAGWATGKSLKTELCINALKSAVMKHRPPEGLIHHSDRGVQYCSTDYQALLKKYSMKCSMSRKGNCYDNACAETFFGTIKCEMIYHHKFATREEAHKAIFEYIEIFYNRKRRHQALGYLTPIEYKHRYMQSLAA